MRRRKRTHTPEFKVEVALAAFQGDLTIAELVTKTKLQSWAADAERIQTTTSTREECESRIQVLIAPKNREGQWHPS